jgi:hypothetical protein
MLFRLPKDPHMFVFEIVFLIIFLVEAARFVWFMLFS